MYSSDLKCRILEAVTSYQHYAQGTEGLQKKGVPLKFKYYRLGKDGVLLFMDIIYVSDT
jgi:hypothetical protein